MGVRCRCPNPDCRKELDLDTALLGRNIPCPQCGQVITIVPIAVAEAAVHERDRAIDEKRRPLPVRLALENIRSLWNVGAIFRTCDGAGVEELYLCGITGTPPRKEITKTALGAELSVPWRHMPTAVEAIESARTDGCSVVALEKTPESVPVSEAELTFPLCLVAGSETVGVSREALVACDGAVHLPMRGIKQSLNVAVAVAVALYRVAEMAESESQMP